MRTGNCPSSVWIGTSRMSMMLRVGESRITVGGVGWVATSLSTLFVVEFQESVSIFDSVSLPVRPSLWSASPWALVVSKVRAVFPLVEALYGSCDYQRLLPRVRLLLSRQRGALSSIMHNLHLETDKQPFYLYVSILLQNDLQSFHHCFLP